MSNAFFDINFASINIKGFNSSFSSEWPNHDGSKLRIKKVSSRETGTYRCTGVNVKDQYIHTTGYVKIRRKIDCI